MNDEKPKDDMPAMTPAEIEKVEDAAIRSMENMNLPGLKLSPAQLEEKILEDEDMVEGIVMEITQTDTITAKIAQLPVTALSIDFIVEVMTPIHLVPQMIQIGLSHKELTNDPDVACRELLKKDLLAEWHSHFDDPQMTQGEVLPEWIKKVDKVELIECDLLVPKEKKQ